MNKERAIAKERHVPAPAPPAGLEPTTSMFLSQIKLASSKVPHSDANATYNRNKYMSMVYKFGKPQLWISLNPNVHNNKAFCFLATGEYFELQPSSTDRYNFLSNSPAAASLWFERNLDSFIEQIIGWCIETKSPFLTGGCLPCPQHAKLIHQEEVFDEKVQFPSQIFGDHLERIMSLKPQERFEELNDNLKNYHDMENFNVSSEDGYSDESDDNSESKNGSKIISGIKSKKNLTQISQRIHKKSKKILKRHRNKKEMKNKTNKKQVSDDTKKILDISPLQNLMD